MGERPMPGEVEDGSPLAEALGIERQQQAGTAGPYGNGADAEAGARILEHLQAQLAQRDQQVVQERQRADRAELTASQAEEQITKAYNEATQGVQAANAKRIAAEQHAQGVEKQSRQKASYFATVSLGIAQRIFDHATWALAFLINKLPALFALYGGFLLWGASLSDLSVLTLIALGLYGVFIVLPTVWLAVRTERPPPADQIGN